VCCAMRTAVSQSILHVMRSSAMLQVTEVCFRVREDDMSVCKWHYCMGIGIRGCFYGDFEQQLWTECLLTVRVGYIWCVVCGCVCGLWVCLWFVGVWVCVGVLV
jgi:hypothetical protein